MKHANEKWHNNGRAAYNSQVFSAVKDKMAIPSGSVNISQVAEW